MEEMIKRVFMVGGLSESGKSSVGGYLDSKGIRRRKIVEFLKEVMEKENSGINFNQWQEQTIENRSVWLWKAFIKNFKSKIQKEKIKYCVLESLYRPSLAQALRKAFGKKLVIIYVDIPLEIRLQRQMIRQNLKTLEEAKAYLLPRDNDKMEWGALQIKEIADVIIDNSGTIDDLYRQVDEIIEQYCPELKQN